MIKSRLNIGHVIIGLGAVLVLAIMFGPQQKSDAFVTQNQGVIQHLRHLQQLDAKLSKSILQSRLYLQADNPSGFAILRESSAVVQALQQHISSWLTTEKIQALDAQLQSQQHLLEQLASSLAMLKANLTALGQEQQRISSHKNPQLRSIAYAFVAETLLAYPSIKAESLQQTKKSWAHMLAKANMPATAKPLQTLLMVMDNVLQASLNQEQTIRLLFDLPFQGQVQALIFDYEKMKLESATQSQSNRLSLALLALLLLMYIAYIIIRLRVASSHLEDSMQDLKHLKFALDQHAIVTMTDAQGVMTYANDNLCRITLYNQDELIGKTHQFLNSGYHSASFFSEMWSMINGGNVWHGEIQNIKKNKHKYWVESTIVPFVSKEGVLQRFIAISSDITQRKQAEIALKEREKHIRNVLDTALDSVLILDEMGRASYWNPQAERTFGWLAKDIIGSPILDNLFPPEHLRHFQNQSFNSLLKDRVELVAIHQDGHQFPVEVAISLLDSGGDFHFSAFIRDISERKASEEALKIAHDQALESSRLKSSFLSTVSHEIRTPMNGIIGMTDLILDTPLDDEQAEFAETIRQSAEALLCIINDILDFSKIEAGKMSVEPIPFSISSVVGGVVDTLMVKTRDKPVTLSYRIDDALSDSLVGDPGRLRQILLNLTDNALKFTKKGQVKLKILQQKIEHDVAWVYIEISDTGIGLSEQGQQRLFKPFSQADGSTTRKYGGTGLGLSICARLIALMKGEVAVKSTLGEGSVFYFTIPLPVAAPLRQKSDIALQHLPSKHQARVLLVEDNAVNQRVASLHLKKLGITPDIANNGQEAVAAVQRQHYDLIFMDCQMPVMDGFAATAAIRRVEAEQEGQHQPIVAMTANAMKGDKEQCLAAGMDDYLSKPISAADLDAMLHQWLPDSSKAELGGVADVVALDAGASVVNLAWLEDMFGDDRETIRELLTMFVDNAATIVLNMENCTVAQEMQGLAHELKGAAANIGIHDIAEVAKLIEQHPEQEHQHQLQALHQHIEHIRQFIGTTLAS